MNASPFKSFSPACPEEPGAFKPVVNRARCEGKQTCLQVCPNDVFEIRRMSKDDFDALNPFERLKSLAHGRKTAYAVRADQCQACGLCIAVCPEDAITLVRL